MARSAEYRCRGENVNSHISPQKKREIAKQKGGAEEKQSLRLSLATVYEATRPR